MTVKPIPDGYHAVTPYLIVDDAPGLIDFLHKVFGATQLLLIPRPDGSIAHCEMRIGDSVIMLANAAPQYPALRSMLYIYVPDADAAFARALAAGATVIAPLADQFYGDRSGGVAEPCGNMIWIATHIEDISPENMVQRAAESR